MGYMRKSEFRLKILHSLFYETPKYERMGYGVLVPGRLGSGVVGRPRLVLVFGNVTPGYDDMLPQFLVPETTVREAGKSGEFEIPTGTKLMLITLGINRIVEQQSLDVAIYGSADGTTWSAKPLLRFPQKFYCGTYALVLDLAQTSDVRFLRVEYKLNRWGRGDQQPLFGLYVYAEAADGKAAHRAVA